MKYAIIDTEGSGLFDFTKPADAPGQPRLASFGVLFVHTAPDEPANFDERQHFVAPDGWEMNPEASAVNGLTTEWLKANGRPVREVLDLYSKLVADGYVIASWGAQHDTKTMRAELRRSGMPDLFETTRNVCLMRAATPICKLPSKRGGYKWPKLAEACVHFGLEPEPTPHQAIEGARRAALILVKLDALNALPAPEVHKAKPDSPALKRG